VRNYYIDRQASSCNFWLTGNTKLWKGNYEIAIGRTISDMKGTQNNLGNQQFPLPNCRSVQVLYVL